MVADDFYTLCSPQNEEEFTRYYQFRWQQLRKPLNLPQGSEQDDFESQAYHCMAVKKDQTIIGVGRLHLDSTTTAQIRFMAIDRHYQRRQIGSQLLKNLLQYAQTAGVKTCWLNARADACDFYRAHGFSVEREIESVLNIPHYRMQKSLSLSI
jgi:ribosomal protein S18 acetylase RimI-like enzyme